jgi:hypothetical protein
VDMKRYAWDLFISHASEDKDSFVRPLATELSRLGLRVWYDEFSLHIGDSLSASIDRGLSESEAGLVVISNAFMAKRWPKRELAGLVAGHMGRDQLILPIWLNVSAEEVLSFSPTLADTIAIDASSLGLTELALRILERVKPELHMAIQRRQAFDQAVASAVPETVRISTLKDSPVRHEILPFDVINRIRLTREVLIEVFPQDWRTAIDNFRKDLHPEDELRIWEFLTSVYLTVVNEFELGPDERHKLYGELLDRITTNAAIPWELPDESTPWERRAYDLFTGKVDPLSDAFASLGTVRTTVETGEDSDVEIRAVRIPDSAL